MSWWRWKGFTVVSFALQRSHALLDSADHVTVQTVAVLTGVLGHDVGSVGVVVPVHIAAGLGGWSLGGGQVGGDVVLGPCHLAPVSLMEIIS